MGWDFAARASSSASTLVPRKGTFIDVHAADVTFTGPAPLRAACPEGALEGI
ncbi:hypothetical protein GCM10009754_49300 [Amycolatopsis minnesotensis]|uniref:Uncharacterized protein n=1 Tax=Amycolatopsis minnesotensis TaxID=337894 RepID=A0ABN2RJT8_9PSEU